MIKNRDDLGRFLNQAGLLGEGVEVGVAFGKNAASLLSTWKGKKLFGVDPYVNYPWEEYRDCCNSDNMEQNLAEATARLAVFGGRYELKRLSSVLACPGFLDESLDFVYIDGNHSYPCASQDMQNWWPKVKPGGVFGGHDCYMRDDPKQLCEVELAVTDFAAAHPEVSLIKTCCTSWWVRKP